MTDQPPPEWKNKICYYGVKPAGEFVANPLNARLHPDYQQQLTAESLATLGWIAPVIENIRTGNLIDGHDRVMQALERGDNEPIPFIQVDLTEDEERQALLTFDAITNQAVYSAAHVSELIAAARLKSSAMLQLARQLAETAQTDPAMGRGHTTTPNDSEGTARQEIAERAQALIKEWDIQPGQVWRLGNQRLGILDSTDGQTVYKLLLGNERPPVIFTDPPYNVAENYELSGADLRQSYRDMGAAEWDSGFDSARMFAALDTIRAADTSIYICSDSNEIGAIWGWLKTFCNHVSYICWCKPNPMPSLTKRQYTWATELIAYGTAGKHRFNFPPSGHAYNYWVIPTEQTKRIHIHQKPVALVVRALSHSAAAGDLVYDAFGGSGTTLEACHRLNMRGAACENDPASAALIVQRMADLGIAPEIEI